MRIFAGTVLLVLLAGPAFAQDSMGINLWNDKPQTSEQKEKNQAIDNEYKSTIKNLPDRKKSGTDPWGTVRGSSTPHSQNAVRSGSK